MTSQLQQLLETFIKFKPDEQEKCLEIAKKIHDILKDEPQRSKEDQQPETSNSNYQEKLTTIQITQENWKPFVRTNFLLYKTEYG